MNRTITQTLTAIVFILASAGLHATTLYVDIDTSSLSGQTGYVDLQFNPTGSPDLASLLTSDFSGAVLDNTTITYMGGASGDIATPGGAQLANNVSGTLTGYNDYNEEAVFGTEIQFDITLSGPALTDTNQSGSTTFAFSLYDSTDTNPLLSTDPSGAMIFVTINQDSSITIDSLSPEATAGLVTPEPASSLLMGSALACGMLVLFYRRIRAAR